MPSHCLEGSKSTHAEWHARFHEQTTLLKETCPASGKAEISVQVIGCKGDLADGEQGLQQ